MSNFLPTDSQAAKQFLLDRLLEQSQRDGVELSDIEKRMFLFSESSGETDWEANQRFEAEYNDTQYEAKIAKLLRHSYADAKKIHRRIAAWQTALTALRDEDFYGLVMIDQARIPRPKPRIAVVGKEIARGFLGTAISGYLIAKVFIVIAALFLLTDPWQWGLLRSDISKLLCLALAAFAAWVVGRIERRAMRRALQEVHTNSSE